MTYTESEFLLYSILLILVMLAVSEALATLCYIVRMKAYERAILSAKDCKMLCIRPPFRLWKKFTVSEGINHAENTSGK